MVTVVDGAVNENEYVDRYVRWCEKRMDMWMSILLMNVLLDDAGEKEWKADEYIVRWWCWKEVNINKIHITSR